MPLRLPSPHQPATSYFVRAVCLATLIVLVTACGQSPVETATLLPAPAETHTRAPMPQTRSAPTLPPTFTPTFTPLPTSTKTPSATATITATLSVEEVCSSINLPSTALNNTTLQASVGTMLVVGGGVEGGVILMTWTHQESGAVNGGPIPTGANYLMQFGKDFVPGSYTWQASVSFDTYSAICAASGQFVVAGAEPTPADPLLLDILQLIIERSKRQQAPTPATTATAEATPEATIGATPTVTRAGPGD